MQYNILYYIEPLSRDSRCWSALRAGPRWPPGGMPAGAACGRVYMYMYMCMYMCLCVCIYVYICIHVCIYIYIYIRIYIYIYTHTYVHTHILKGSATKCEFRTCRLTVFQITGPTKQGKGVQQSSGIQ